MNVEHFNFYFYIILNEFNKIKVAGVYEIFQKSQLSTRVTLSKKENIDDYILSSSDFSEHE
jgi:hypothetical protein